MISVAHRAAVTGEIVMGTAMKIVVAAMDVAMTITEAVGDTVLVALATAVVDVMMIDLTDPTLVVTDTKIGLPSTDMHPGTIATVVVDVVVEVGVEGNITTVTLAVGLHLPFLTHRLPRTMGVAVVAGLTSVLLTIGLVAVKLIC